MQIPPKLKARDEVIIIAPARKVDKKLLSFSLQLLQKWELVPLLSENIMAESGIFSGSKKLRHQDFQDALDHPSARAIWCFRGGYGTTQIIEGINPASFLQNPKWIIGFSDITNFHCFSNIILHTASLHATMPINTQSNTTSTLNSLKNFLMNRKISYKIKSNKLNILGEVEGSLIGGNLSVLCATLGTNYQPDFENKILFIEDIDEYYYKIDRMIWQLKYAGVFHQISGLIIGHFTNLKDNSISFGMSLEEIILEKLNEFNFPVIFDFPAGHENENLAIPFGMKLKLEAKDEYVKLYA